MINLSDYLLSSVVTDLRLGHKKKKVDFGLAEKNRNIRNWSWPGLMMRVVGGAGLGREGAACRHLYYVVLTNCELGRNDGLRQGGTVA